MTQTGTNLLGLVKHVAGIELDYFGEVFDRPANLQLPWLDEGAEINADMWATAEESREDIVALYEQAAVHADATIEALSLDSPGRVHGGHRIGSRSPCTRSWCTSRLKSLGTQAMPTSSASSSTAQPATMTGTSLIRAHNSGLRTGCDSRRRPRKLRSVWKMSALARRHRLMTLMHRQEMRTVHQPQNVAEGIHH